jgi:hypothetical protein
VSLVLVKNWFDEIQQHFGNTMPVRVWYGASSEAPNCPMKSSTLNSSVDAVIKHVGGLDDSDPRMALNIVITSFQTVTQRALVCNGEPIRKTRARSGRSASATSVKSILQPICPSGSSATAEHLSR